MQTHPVQSKWIITWIRPSIDSRIHSPVASFTKQLEGCVVVSFISVKCVSIFLTSQKVVIQPHRAWSRQHVRLLATMCMQQVPLIAMGFDILSLSGSMVWIKFGCLSGFELLEKYFFKSVFVPIFKGFELKSHIEMGQDGPSPISTKNWNGPPIFDQKRQY